MSFPILPSKSPFTPSKAAVRKMRRLTINRLAWPSIFQWRAMTRASKPSSKRTGKNGRPPKCSALEFAALVPFDKAIPSHEWRDAAEKKYGIKKSTFWDRVKKLIVAGVIECKPCQECGAFRYSRIGGAA